MNPFLDDVPIPIDALDAEKLSATEMEDLQQRFARIEPRLIVAAKKVVKFTWQMMEFVYALDSFWERCLPLIDKDEHKRFKSSAKVLAEFCGLMREHDFDAQAFVREISAARDEGLLELDGVTIQELAQKTVAARQIGQIVPTKDLRWLNVAGLSKQFAEAGYREVGFALNHRNREIESPLICLIAEYYFRQAVSTDSTLISAFSTKTSVTKSSSIDAHVMVIDEFLQKEFDKVAGLMISHQQGAAGSAAPALDLRVEQHRIGKPHSDLYSDFAGMVETMKLSTGCVRRRDTRQYSKEADGQLVSELLSCYAALSDEEKNNRLALRNVVGRFLYITGDYRAAIAGYNANAKKLSDPFSKGETLYNAYQCALMLKDFDGALEYLQEAIKCAPRLFIPFPLGKYAMEKILTINFAGVVFACESRSPKAKVTIKTLSDADEPERIMEDIRAVSMANLPGVVKVLESSYVDATRRFAPYIVLGEPEGMSLETRIRENGPMSAADVTAIGLQMTNILHSLHRKDLIHRNLSPESVYIRKVKDEKTGELNWDVLLTEVSFAPKKWVKPVGVALASTDPIQFAPPEQRGEVKAGSLLPSADIHAMARVCCYALFRTADPTDEELDTLTKPFAELLLDCLEEEPHRRPPDCLSLVRRWEKARTAELDADAERSRPAAPPPKPASKSSPDINLSDRSKIPTKSSEEIKLPAPKPTTKSSAEINLPDKPASKPKPEPAQPEKPATKIRQDSAETARPAPASGRTAPVRTRADDEDDEPARDEKKQDRRSERIPAAQTRRATNGDDDEEEESQRTRRSSGASGSTRLERPQRRRNEDDEDDEEHGSSKKGLMIGGVIALMMCAGAVMYFFVFKKSGGGASPETAPEVAQKQDNTSLTPNNSVNPFKTDPVIQPDKKGPDPILPNPENPIPKVVAQPSDLAKIPGDKVFLSDMTELESRQGPWPVTKNGQLGNLPPPNGPEPANQAIKVKGMPYAKGISMHPPDNDGPTVKEYACAQYRLSRAAQRVKSQIAIADTGTPLNEVYFEVRGDGKRIWASTPLRTARLVLDVDVELAGVDVMELRTYVKGNHLGAHAVWLDPYVLKAGAIPPVQEEPKLAPPPKSNERPTVVAMEKGTSYLSDRGEYDVQIGAWPFSKHGRLGNPLDPKLGFTDANELIRINDVEVPKGLSMAPALLGPASVKYRLGKQAGARFFTEVALNDKAWRDLRGATVFEVFGDGKLLWKSEPLRQTGKILKCDIDVGTVDVLELQTSALGSARGAQAVWVNPKVIFSGDVPTELPPIVKTEPKKDPPLVAKVDPPRTKVDPPVKVDPPKPKIDPETAMGKKIYLTFMKAHESEDGLWPITRQGKIGVGDGVKSSAPVKVNGKEYKDAISMHPGKTTPAKLSFQVNKCALAFLAEVGIDESAFIARPATFEVYGDGNLLFLSDDIGKGTAPQKVALDVSNYNVVELRTKMAGNGTDDCRAIWIDPYFVWDNNKALPLRQTFLAEVTPFDLKGGYQGWNMSVGKLGDVKAPVELSVDDKPAKKGICMHPGPNVLTSMKFPLNRKYAKLVGKVGLNDTAELTPPKGSAIFEISVDEKVVWTSKPVGKSRTFEDFEIDVKGAGVMQLRTKAQGSVKGLDAVWIDPVLTLSDEK